MNYQQCILELMSDSKPHTTEELNKITHKFGEVIDNLRKKGCLIKTIRVAPDLYAYHLQTPRSLSIEELKTLSSQLPETIPYVKLLVLFGSRATVKNHDSSDWDFAVLYNEKAEGKQDQEKYERYLEVLDYLSEVLKINRDAIDLVELDRCSPLLGHQVARDGKLIYESHVGEFLNFRVRAWKIYADTAKFRKVQKESIHLWLKKWSLQ